MWFVVKALIIISIAQCDPRYIKAAPEQLQFQNQDFEKHEMVEMVKMVELCLLPKQFRGKNTNSGKAELPDYPSTSPQLPR